MEYAMVCMVPGKIKYLHANLQTYTSLIPVTAVASRSFKATSRLKCRASVSSIKAIRDARRRAA